MRPKTELPVGTSPDSFRTDLNRLVEQFGRNLKQYKSNVYDEASLRQEFLDPLFRALGWDVENKAGLIPQHREVEIESRTNIAGRQKRADFLFRTDRQDRFICEAKKPVETLDSRYAFQAKRYAWNKGLVLAVLTDFEEMRIYVVGSKPHPEEELIGLWKTWQFQQYPLVAQEIWDLLARSSVAEGSIEKLVEQLPRKPVAKGKARQQWLFKPDRTRTIDADFLNFLDEARRELASDLLRQNNRADLLEGTRLNEAVQRILDRLLFLRICEDRDIDTGRPLASILKYWRANADDAVPRRVRPSKYLVREDGGAEDMKADHKPPVSLWREVVAHFRALDHRPASQIPFFNGNLFKPHFSEDLVVGEEWLAHFLDDVGDDESPYLFNYIPVEILGIIYERFLGKIVRPHGRGVIIEEKPEVRKAGGVYYTPRYIVEYIVAQTVGKLLAGRTLEEALQLRILDPACGSGSFLIHAFEVVCEHCQQWLTDHRVKRNKDWCWVEENAVHLTSKAKRRILRETVHGVDLDPQAVEVTQLSLYLKMLENVNRATLSRERDLFGSDEALLPPLENNIKCGNSLIASDFSLVPDDLVRVHAFDWPVQFPAIMKAGGFDAVIGNPPYGACLDESQKDYLANGYTCQSYQLDSYLLFLERSVRDLLRIGGFYGMIIPNPWLTNVLQGPTRKFICQTTKVHEIVHFKFPVFPKVTVNTEIVVLEKGKPDGWLSKVSIFDKLQSGFEALAKASKTELAHSQDKWRLLDGAVINIFTSEQEEKLAAKLTALGARLDTFCEINVGIKPYQVGKGDPPQIRKTVETRPFDSETKRTKRHRLYLRGCDIKRYLIAPLENRYLDYGPWLAEPRPAANFDAPVKIFIRQTSDSLVGTLDVNCFLCLNNMHVLVPISDTFSPRFLLGIINSKLLNWFYQTLNPEVGEALAEVKRTNVARLPIQQLDLSKPIDRARHDKLVELVDKMLVLTPKLRAAKSDAERQTLQNAVTATDQQIDALVYELYGLTKDEIKLVEGTP